MKHIAAASLCLILWTSPGIAASCENWSTVEFFETATVEEVTACLRAGADPNVRVNGFGDTPLHRLAAKSSNPGLFQGLLKAGADPNTQNEYGSTPLHMTVWNRHPVAIEILLEAGADHKATTQSGDTSLHMAVENDNLPVIEALLTEGADSNALNTYGVAPLHIAVQNENLAAVKALLTKGADSNTPTKSRITPLHMAVQENNLNLAEVLLAAGADPKERDLSVAAGNENLAIVKGLLKAGIDPVYLGTALDMASWKDNLAIVEVLLEADVDLNRWISYGISPLFPAARGAGAAVIKALLKAGADPGVRTSKTKVHGGATPLHVAAQFNHNPAAIEALVEAGSIRTQAMNTAIRPYKWRSEEKFPQT